MTKEQIFEHPPRGHVALLAYDSVNDRFQVVHVDASGLLQVDVADVADPQVNAHGYDGSVWRKQPLIWGYSDSLWGQASGTAAAAATYFLVGDLVPPGEVWVVNRLSWYRSVNVPTIVRLSVYTAGAYVNMIDYDATIVSKFESDALGAVLKAGERLRFGFAGATVDEYCEAHWWGYKMSIDM